MQSNIFSYLHSLIAKDTPPNAGRVSLKFCLTALIKPLLLWLRHPCGTCELDSADNGVLGVHQFKTLIVEITDCERLAETKVVNIDDKTLGYLSVSCFNL